MPTPGTPAPSVADLSPADAHGDSLWHLLFSFRGRLSRRQFWLYGVFGVGLAWSFLAALLDIAGLRPALVDDLCAAITAWPALAISAKRWHDRNKSAWWLLLLLIVVIGQLWTAIECCGLRGTVGPNRYGPDPLAPDPTRY